MMLQQVPGKLTFMFARKEGKGILLREDAPVVMELNGVASDIWELIDGERTVGEIAASVSLKYGAPLDVVEVDVAELLCSMAGNCLVELKEKAEPTI